MYTFVKKTMSLSMFSQYLTVQEVAGFLQLSTLTIYKYIKEGRLDAVEFGGHYRVSKQSLELFLLKHKVGGGK